MGVNVVDHLLCKGQTAAEVFRKFTQILVRFDGIAVGIVVIHTDDERVIRRRSRQRERKRQRDHRKQGTEKHTDSLFHCKFSLLVNSCCLFVLACEKFGIILDIIYNMLSPGCQAKKSIFGGVYKTPPKVRDFIKKTAQKEIKNYFPYFSC